MDTVTLSLHAELAVWLNEIAAKRGLTLSEATQQLLEEERMRDLFVKEIEVPIGECRWRASISTRGLMYSGYEATWQRLDSDRATPAAAR